MSICQTFWLSLHLKQFTMCFIGQARGICSSWSISHVLHTRLQVSTTLSLQEARASCLGTEVEILNKSDWKPSLARLHNPARTSSVRSLSGWIDWRFCGFEEEELPAGAVTEWHCEPTDCLSRGEAQTAGMASFWAPQGPSLLTHCLKWVRLTQEHRGERMASVRSADIKENEPSRQWS